MSYDIYEELENILKIYLRFRRDWIRKNRPFLVINYSFTRTSPARLTPQVQIFITFFTTNRVTYAEKSEQKFSLVNFQDQMF